MEKKTVKTLTLKLKDFDLSWSLQHEWKISPLDASKWTTFKKNTVLLAKCNFSVQKFTIYGKKCIFFIRKRQFVHASGTFSSKEALSV